MIRSTLRHFTAPEFRHPDLVDDAAAVWLDDIRQTYGAPLELTSDARTLQENAATPGSSPTSLHLIGRAFDLRWIADPVAFWRFVDAVFLTSGARPVELIFPYSVANRHIHLGLYPETATPHQSRLEIRTD